MAFFWGLAGSVFFLFGFVDTMYFLAQGMDAPEELAWLNNAGIFSETKTFTGDPTIVEKEDLYLTNILGIVIIVVFLLVLMCVFSRNGLKNRAIA